jgi:hypothetical protein
MRTIPFETVYVENERCVALKPTSGLVRYFVRIATIVKVIGVRTPIMTGIHVGNL